MSLVEVLIACAVFVVVGVALVGGVRTMGRTIRSVNRQNEVRLGLQSRAAEARGLPVEIGVEKEKPDEDGIVYEREWRALPLANQDKIALPDLYLLTVRARWVSQGRENVEETILRVYSPPS